MNITDVPAQPGPNNSPANGPVPATGPSSGVVVTGSGKDPRKKWLIIGGVVLVLLIGLIIWMVASEDEPPLSNNPIVASYQQQLPALQEEAANKPDDAKAQSDYAVALYATGDINKAKNQYETAVNLDPNNATLRNNLGNTLRDLEDYDGAVKRYQEALAIDPKLLNSYMNLANLYLYTLDKADLAIKTYEDALQNLPGNQELQVLLGIAYEQSGNNQKAKATYEAVLEANPNNAGAQAGLQRVQ